MMRFITAVLVPEYVVVETCTALTKLGKKADAEEFLSLVLGNRDVEIYVRGQQFFDAVLSFYRSAFHNDLSFVDVSLLYLSAEYKVITFDRKLASAIAARHESSAFN